MNKSAKSLLLAAMMAVSGFAVAQPSAPTNDVKSGTQGGSGPSASEKAAPGGMPASRAEVKSQAEPMKSGTQGGSGPSANEKAAPGNMPASRAEVKSQAEPMKSGIQGGSGASPSTNPNTAMTGSNSASGSKASAQVLSTLAQRPSGPFSCGVQTVSRVARQCGHRAVPSLSSKEGTS